MTDADTLHRQAEECVIGALLLDNKALYRTGPLEDIDFIHPVLRRVFVNIRDRVHEGQSVDTVTVRELTEGDEDWAYLCDIVHNTPSSANIESYAELLRRASKRKRAAAIGRQLAEDMQALEDPDDVISEAQVELSKTSTRNRADLSWQDACALLDAHMQRDDAAFKTGLPTLDNVLGGGFKRGQLAVLGARPGCYKSAFAQQTALKAIVNNRNAAILNLEMTPVEIALRGRQAGYDGSGLRLDCESFSIDAIAARIAEWKYQWDVGFIVVDYLQLITAKGKSRFEQLSEVSRRLKLLAKQFEVAILAPAQLSREVEKEHREARLSDLRECGNIEQDADVVLFINHKVVDEEDFYSLTVAKQRGGLARCRPIHLHVDGPRFRVSEAAR